MEQDKHTETGARGTITPNANVQSAMTQLWEIIRQTGEVLVSLRDDNRTLSAKVVSLEQQLSGQEHVVSGVQSETETLRTELARRDEAIAVLRAVAEQSDRERIAGEEAASELRERLGRYEETIRRLTLRIAEQDEQLFSLNSTVVEYEQAKADMALAAQQAEEHKAVVQQLRERLAAALALSKDVEFLRAELVRRNTELNARINEALHQKERAAELENKLYEYQKAHTALREARAALEAQSAEVSAARAAVEEAEHNEAQAVRLLEQLRVQFEHVAAQLDDLRQQNTELQKQLEESRNVEQDLLTRIQQLHDDNDAMRSSSEDQQREAVELAAQLAQLRVDIGDYEAKSKSAVLQAEQLSAELAELRSHAEQEAEQLRTLRGEYDTAEFARLTAEEELAELRTALQSAEEATKHAVARAEQLSVELAELRNRAEQEAEQLRTLRGEYDTAEFARLTAEEELEQLRTQLQDAEQQSQSAAQQAAQLLTELDDLRSRTKAESEQLSALRTEYTTAEEARRVAESALAELRTQIQDAEIRQQDAGISAEQLTAELAAAHRRATESEEHVQALRRDYDATESARRAAEAEREALRQRCAELAEELQQSTRTQVSRDIIEEKEAQITALQARIEEKERETEQLQRKLDDVQTVGSLFAVRNDTAEPAVAPQERAAVIASVQALLQKVEHVLRAEPRSGQ